MVSHKNYFSLFSAKVIQIVNPTARQDLLVLPIVANMGQLHIDIFPRCILTQFLKRLRISEIVASSGRVKRRPNTGGPGTISINLSVARLDLIVSRVGGNDTTAAAANRGFIATQFTGL